MSSGSEASQLTDVMPTLLDAAGVACPAAYRGRSLPPPEGRSFLPALRGRPLPEGTLYWEHTGNAAIRRGRWKLVREFPRAWELYDMERDRSELHDLAAAHPDTVRELEAAWLDWARRVGVIPWPVILAVYRAAGQRELDATGG